jgi:hypothetical protein
MKTVNVTLLILVLALACGASAAQIKVDKTHPATPTGEVYIENIFGSVKVVGWDRDEVGVTGTLGPGIRGFEIDGDEGDDGETGEVYVEVEVPGSAHHESGSGGDFESHIIVSVPRGSSVGVETINASIDVNDVDGAIEIETINGAITIAGDPSAVEIESITGAIQVDAVAATMEVESVAGAITLTGVERMVSVEAVSGSVDITGRNVSELGIETMAGNIRFQGSLAAKGDLDIETYAGNVELVLPSDVKANFEMVTFSGKIENDIGPTPRSKGAADPFTELEFSTDLDADFDVSIETFSGNIAIRVGG